MRINQDISSKLQSKNYSELIEMINDENCPHQRLALSTLIEKMITRISQLEECIFLLNGSQTVKRKRTIYFYEDVELTDELLVEYIDTEAFTLYELEKIVGAKKNVLRGRYIRAKKQIEAQKYRNNNS